MHTKKGMTLFSGIGCPEGERSTQTIDDTVKNVGALAKEMGMSDRCVKDAQTRTRNGATSGYLSGSVDVMGGLAGSASMEAGFQNSYAGLDDSMREQGCGSAFMDMKKILDTTRAINCTLNRSSVESATAVQGSVSIVLDVTPIPTTENPVTGVVIPGTVDRLIQDKKDARALVRDLAAMGLKNLARDAYRDLSEINRKINRMGSIAITNSVLIASASTRIRQVSELTADTQTELQGQYSKVVEAAAENALSQHAGTRALSQPIKNTVMQQMETRQEQIEKNVTETVSRTRVDVSSQSSIKITSTDTIDIVNSTLSASMEVDIITESLVKSAVAMGRSIATELMAKAASSTELDQKSEGHNELNDGMQDGNANSINANKPPTIDKRTMRMVLVGVVAIVGAVVAAKLGKGMSKRRSNADGDQDGGDADGGVEDGGVERSGMFGDAIDTVTGVMNSRPVRILVGVLVRLLVVMTLLRNLKKTLTSILTPWKIPGALMWMGGSIAAWLAYVFLIRGCFNPISAIITCW